MPYLYDNGTAMTDLKTFIEAARQENQILRENGAEAQAKAREALLIRLEEWLQEASEELLTVEQAARLADVHTETVRRAIRDGRIPANTSTFPTRVPRSSLSYLKTLSRKKSGGVVKDETNSYSPRNRLIEAAMNSV